MQNIDLNSLLNGMSDAQQKAFQEILIEKSADKGTLLQPEGRVANSFYFITEGLLRSYFHKDGDDVTDFFFFENDFAADFASYYSGAPSKLNLECLEPTSFLEIRKEDLDQLYTADPSFEKYGRYTAEFAFLQVEERMRLLHTEDLETKYKWMLQKFPQIFQRVPQYHIASYLGVKAESLSRIKKKIGLSF